MHLWSGRKSIVRDVRVCLQVGSGGVLRWVRRGWDFTAAHVLSILHSDSDLCTTAQKTHPLPVGKPDGTSILGLFVRQAA